MNTINWGRHRPNLTGKFLGLFTQIGLGRGAIRRIMIREWRKGACCVDVKVRGIRYRLDIANNTTDAKILTSSLEYDKSELNALAHYANKDAVFFDIGANTGYYALNMLKRGFGRVVAIEPNPPTLKLLTDNVALNDESGVIKILPYCVGPNETIPFYSNKGLGTASVISDGKEPTHYVQSMPLIDMVRITGVSRIDAMKIDVEGFEVNALKPFFENAPKALFPKIIVMEDCHKDLWGFDLIGFICDIGYSRAGKTRGNIVLKMR